MPGWLMAIWWGSLIFSAAYLIFYALSFGEGSMEAEYRGETQQALAGRPDATSTRTRSCRRRPRSCSPARRTPRSCELGAARFARTCAACHGEQAQGLIGPNLTDDRWIHGGSVEQIFQTVAKGWPAKGMPPWGRALKPEELAALVSYVRSLQGSNPPNATPAGGRAGRARADPGELTWAIRHREEAAGRGARRRPAHAARLRRRAGGGSPLQPLGRREAEVHASRSSSKGRFWKIRRGRSPTACSCSSSRCRSIPVGGHPAAPVRHRGPPLPRLRRHLLPDRQPHPRGVRLRRHRHRLLRRLDVRADVVRLRLPADRLPRVPLPSHRGVPRGRAGRSSGS